jgi:hypothetical protein
MKVWLSKSTLKSYSQDPGFFVDGDVPVHILTEQELDEMLLDMVHTAWNLKAVNASPQDCLDVFKLRREEK